MPGVVDSWAEALARHGSLPLARVLAPAIEYAHDGFAVSDKLAEWFGFQVTGGSTAVRSTGEYGMRVAGAAAKDMLLAAAAKQWGVNGSECVAKGSRIAHAASGRSVTFGELARSAALQSVPTSPALKNSDSFTIRRTSPKRLDIPSKVDGTATYAIDFTTPDMLYAALDIGYITQQQFDQIMAEAIDVNGSIVRFRTALENTPPKAARTARQG